MAKTPAKAEAPWTHRGVRLGFIRNGVYYCERTVHGRRLRPSTGCRTADAAFDEYKKFEADPLHYVPRSQPGTAWEPAVLDFLAYQQFTQGRTEGYVEEQARYLQRWGERKPFFSLDTFTREDIESFLADLQRGEVTTKMVFERDAAGQPVLDADGQPRKVRAAAPGIYSRNRYLAALTKFMAWAREHGRTKNEADLKVHQLREPKHKESRQPVPDKNWKAVASKLPDRWRLAHTVLVGSGIRYGELAAMRAAHLHPSATGGVLDVPDSKGKVGRRIPISKNVLQAAKELLTMAPDATERKARAERRAQENESRKAQEKAPLRELTERDFGPIPDDNGSQFDKRVEAACRAAEVPVYTAHELRHTYATTCLRNGMDPLELQRRLGHANLKTTEVYLHVVRTMKGDAKNFAPV